MLNRGAWLAMGVFVALAAPGCERTAEKTAEAMIQDAMKEAGVTDADVDLSKGGVSFRAEGESGKTVFEMAGEGEASLPAGFPKDVPVFPGSSVIMSISAEGEGLSTTLLSAEPAERVYAFYIDELKKSGWTIDQEIKASPTFILHGTKGEREVAVTLSGSDEGTSISIIVPAG